MRSSFEGRLEAAFCEEPEAFHIFSSSDGLAARVAANRKGLVAVFLGVSRYNKWSLNGRTYDFLAIPSGLAERLASGAAVLLEEASPKARVAIAAMRRWMAEERCGDGTALRLASPEVVRDIEKQLRRIAEG